MTVLHVAAAGTCHTGLARFALLNMTAFAGRMELTERSRDFNVILIGLGHTSAVDVEP